MGGRAARWWTQFAPTACRSAALLPGRAVAPADKGGASGTPLALVPHRPLQGSAQWCLNRGCTQARFCSILRSAASAGASASMPISQESVVDAPMRLCS